MADDSAEVVKEQSESVSATNLKCLGDAPAFYQNQAYAESLANTQAMNQLRMTILGKIAESVISTDATENGQLIPLMQQLMKGAQSTNPQTGGQPGPVTTP